MLKRIFKILVLILIISFFASCTVVRHDEKGKKSQGDVTFYFESKDFDAASYVKENWDSQIIPEIRDNAVQLEDLIDLLGSDQEEAEKKYGIRKEDTSPYAYIVKGEYAVKELNRDSAVGYLYIDQSDLSDGLCAIQVGPVFKLSAVRDALSFINFGDFSNQIEFANISREINFYVRDNVTAGLGDTVPENSRVSFYGVFLMDKEGKVIITPVILDLSTGE
ncbi:MAG: DUF2291 domain-containing protein [Spirochaetales bacterium]|nr:DUF2291 domain-containing protein [Spirochaetales bacterium]